MDKRTPLVNKMRFLAWCAALQPPLPATALRCAIVITNHYNYNSPKPGALAERMIAKECHINRRNLRPVIDTLVARDVISFTPGKLGSGHTASYVPNIKKAC